MEPTKGSELARAAFRLVQDARVWRDVPGNHEAVANLERSVDNYERILLQEEPALFASGPKRKVGVRGAARGIDWDAQPLGQVTDKALAAQLGCHTNSVLNARKRRGIGPARRNAR